MSIDSGLPLKFEGETAKNYAMRLLKDPKDAKGKAIAASKAFAQLPGALMDCFSLSPDKAMEVRNWAYFKISGRAQPKRVVKPPPRKQPEPQKVERIAIKFDDGESNIVYVLIKDIVLTENYRGKDLDVESMVASFKKHGQLKPISLSQRKDGKLYYLDGMRRIKAAEILGREILCAKIWRGLTLEQERILKGALNIESESWTWISEAKYYHVLKESSNLSVRDISKRFPHRKESRISDLINDFLFVSNNNFIHECMKLSSKQITNLRKIKDPKVQTAIIEKVRESPHERIRASDVERWIGQKKRAVKHKPKTTKKLAPTVGNYFNKLIKRFKQFSENIVSTDRFILVCGDAEELIKKVPDKSIGLVFTDPPYSLGGNPGGGLIDLPDREPLQKTTVEEWNKPTFYDQYKLLADYKRILTPKGNLFIFTSDRLFGGYYNWLEARFDRVGFGAWRKKDPAPQVRKVSFLSALELWVHAWNLPHTWNFTTQSEMHNVIEAPICKGNERRRGVEGHTAQKPQAVLVPLTRVASEALDVVLDPYAGTGSTGIAAVRNDRRFIGFEKDPKHFDIMVEWFTEEFGGET